MKKTVNVLFLSAIALFTSILFYACSKDSSSGSMDSSVPSGKQNVSLYLTDAPGYFDKVLIDIQSVQVLVDTCSGNDRYNRHDTCNVWEPLTVTPGIYDLLTLRNGADTLLAGSTIPAGDISLIKIQLGPEDSLVKDSISYPLTLRDSSIVLINVQGNRWDQYGPGRFRLWLDFDVSRSIVNVSNNQFYLDPFIRVFTLNTTGSVSGVALPYNAYPVISVYNSSDTSYALPDRFGNFEVRGLAAGNYSVFINTSNGYADTTIANVTVAAGQNDFLGNIRLHK
jgi:hypothetical protein